MRITVLFLLFCSSFCFAQNKVNEKGQKYGHWEHIDSFAIVYRNTGNYKIVSIAAFNTTTWRQGYDRKDGKMSVRNGMWLGYNIAGKKIQEEDYSDGICKIVKDYDSAGNLTALTYIDTLGSGKKWTISYRGGRPFAKWPYNGCPCDVVYYPEAKLHISRAEFFHDGSFTFDTVRDEIITLRATDSIQIMSITCKDVDILDRKHNIVTMPVRMKKGDTASWLLRYHARAATYTGEDTIHLLTSDTTIYKIYCSARMSHLSADNIGETRTIILSASKDKYLWVDKFGVEGYAYIKFACIAGVTGKQDCVSFDKEIDKLNISKYEPGNYELIVMASSYGDVKNTVINLIIRK